MGFFNDMVGTLSHNISMNECFSDDVEYKYGRKGDLQCLTFMGRICPSNQKFQKEVLYSFQMSCDESSTKADIRAKLYHDRNKISPNDLIEIGNKLNNERPFCPFFFDPKAGRGVVATEFFHCYIYEDDPDEDDQEFYIIRSAETKLSQFYHKLFWASSAYIRHDCI